MDSDPCFVDSSNPAGTDGEFGTWDDGLRLTADSNCIDAADGDAAPSRDILNLWRVDINDVNNKGTGDPNYADMGAYEFSPEPSFTVHFSDALIADENDVGWYSEAFVDDAVSDILGAGDYDDTNEALPGVLRNGGPYETFDGIIIHKYVRLIIYSEKDFAGDIHLDRTGPAVIYDSWWEGDSGAYKKDEDWSDPLQDEFPQRVREWSETYMSNKLTHENYWTDGSFKIIKVRAR